MAMARTRKQEVLTELAVLDINGKPIPCGSFDEMEKKYCEFAALQKQYNKQNANYLSQDQLYKNDCSPPKPVDVDNTVIEYIKEKYPQEWKKIIGKDVKMDSGKMFFNSKQTVLAHFARQKFITLYQKIATELQEQTLPCKPSQRLLLEAEFPELLLTPCPDKQSIHVTGGYVSMERLSRFLKNYFQSPVRSTGHAAPKASIKDSYPPATQDSKKDEEETCPICMDTLTEKQMLPKCKHSFCKDCLKRAFDFKPACPICGVLYGKLKGTQPEKGTMKVTYEASHLPGYEKYGTIVINYYIPSGIQGDEHPSPGQTYEGASRTAYLPESSEGKKVLKLLQQAFEQRLIFTIGRSSTSGRNNVVTWNDIHHKTSRTGGPSCYGYPDPEYLTRVQEELKVKGIC